jgi:methyl farnesoate epoxidase / farnesoate epoxidase
VIVSGKEYIKKLYNCEELNGRPDGFFFRIRTFNKRLGIVFTDGDLWKSQRNFSVKTLKTLGFGKSSMVDKIERESEELIKYYEKHDGDVISIQNETNNIFDISVMNVMWTLLRGEQYELDDKCIIKLMEMIHKSFQIVDMSGGLLNHFPFIRFLMPDRSGFRPLVQTMKPLWEFLKCKIVEVNDDSDTSKESKNFIEFYCEILKQKTNSASEFSEEQLLALCIDFFQAGSETTSNTLSFAILYMLHHPDVMKKVQSELKIVVGNRLPKLSDRKQLRFTDAVIHEVQRLANVAPLGIAHRALESLTVGEFVIPKNSIVLFNIYSLHTDASWKNPLKFDPKRFLNDAGEIILHENFIPFGMGKRRCVGENLAKSSLFIFFASFMHSFDIEVAENLPGLDGKDGITLSAKPFKVKLTRRHFENFQ